MPGFFAYIDTDKREYEGNQAYECDGSEYTAGNQGQGKSDSESVDPVLRLAVEQIPIADWLY